MIGLFLKEHAQWFLFYFLSLICLNGLLVLDSGLYNVSIIYLNSVYSVLFFLFIGWRYLKDWTQFHRMKNQGFEDLDRMQSPYMSLMAERFQQEFVQQTNELNNKKIQLLEERDDLLAWVHEVKTPLTALKIMIEHVEDSKLQTRLEHEWFRLYMLVDQQLHQTRLQTMEQDNRLEKVELHKVISSEIRSLKAWCIEKGIGFEIEDLELVIVTDLKWLAFIFRQILSNAVKYSHANSEVRIFMSQQQGNWALHIQDSGIGIAPEDLPRIFRKSYTGSVGRESTVATGMGLYLAQNAATKLGIKLTVNSKVNEGSTVTLIFPEQNEYTKLYGM
ncbi:ATP-binding protein [Solibacillus sp. R5-41]|uniref:sensor histidine kinase n=1 Tax=Solibacillus sp. R5-41 TaxID=2048654 RepID=UPI000C126CE4|nr:sensor histidine kinase [Solibacillus sp. R5-41]ATP42212.1 ATP-binding protein [Solibacillus sp. R5-41]